MLRTITLSIRLTIGLILLISCASQDRGGYVLPKQLTCHISYRPDMTCPLDQQHTVEVTQPMALFESEQIVYPDLIFELIYSGTNHEGYSINVAVTDAHTTAPPLSKTLYQLGTEDLISHNYAGGHGFTGLHYVFHPISQALLQWWCSAVLD